MSPVPLAFDVSDVTGLVRLRRNLHRAPEISGEEKQTAALIARHVAALKPDRLVTGLGGHGVAAVFDSGHPGPALLFRCELDGLPIREIAIREWRSQVDGKGHLCGHDGHMAIMAGLAGALARRRPARGRVIVLFQPAEETGAGAAAVIADPAFEAIRPDFAFALHNLPGMPLGVAGIRSGAFNFASEGLRIRLEGKTAHAAQPEAGLSPAAALCELVTGLPLLPSRLELESGSALVTLVHARLGEAAFGIAPGAAEIWATVRSIDDDLQSRLMLAAREMAAGCARQHGLAMTLDTEDRFAACHNDAEATAHVMQAFASEGARVETLDRPFRWSEDFGLFGSVAKSALFVLGSGVDHPRLHNPDYDFPDDLIPLGVRLFERLARDICG
ncbi:amidohydrolase [Hoeflea sp. YIM 152468]|uniref:amidohydrolase n=1 Tax=Hoeflea sp. YIM 152468 TaxID=3031759 RepID=UPI0023D9D522|nr:amidohydrolase [Hoeflea sp. YIM 152468]MDF1608246.1 amidohydrolase [Hoeflea sp. YIM 152468]